jgi:tetratricopeptide (TPR) repeat protein
MERDWAGSERAYRRAVDLSPNSGFAHSTYAFHLIAMKHFDEAVAESRLAVELEPTSVLFNRNACLNLYFARRYDEAIAQCKKTLELDPNMPTAYLWLAKSYERKRLYDQAVEAYLKTAEFNGSDAEAVLAFRQAYVASGWEGFWRKALELKRERAKQGKASPVRLAENYARLGDKEQAFVWLDKLLLGNGWELVVLNADPAWDDLRSDARYSNLIRQAGLAP